MPYDASGFNEAYRNYTGGGGYYPANNIFSRLTVLDIFGDGGSTPDLAASWEVLDEGARYRFHLRKDVRWHDGTPFTGEDVRETYMTAIARGYHAATYLRGLRDVKVVDPHTIDLVLDGPNGGLLAQLGLFVWTHILPAHLYKGTDWATNPANDKPVGTGPYRFKEWERGMAVRMVASPDHFRGRPAIDEVEFRVTPLDRALDAVLAGDLDYCQQYAPCQRLDELNAKPGVATAESSGNALGHLSFNLRRAPWSDRRVRGAVVRALDSTELSGGCPRAMPVRDAYLRKVTWVHDPAARFPDFDPATARALLDAAGLRHGPDGTRVRARLVVRDLYRFYQDAAARVVKALDPLGIRVTVEKLDATAWKQQVSEANDFDLAVDGGDIGPDPTFLEQLLASDGQHNITGYSDPEFDRALRAGRAGLTREARGAAYRQALALLVRDMPRFHFVQHGSHLAHRTAFEGWSWDDGIRGTVPFWSLEHVRPRAT
jgi:ABC-type transport system substrate-binding protein